MPWHLQNLLKVQGVLPHDQLENKTCSEHFLEISGNNNAGTLPCKCRLCPTNVTRGSGKTYPKAQPIYRDWKLLSRVLLRVKHLTIFSSDRSLIYTYRDILYNMCRGQRVPLWGIVMLCSRGFYVSTQHISTYAWIHGHPMTVCVKQLCRTIPTWRITTSRAVWMSLLRLRWTRREKCVDFGAPSGTSASIESITAEKFLMSKNNEKYVFLYFLQEKQCFWASYLSVCFGAGMWPFSVHDIQTLQARFHKERYPENIKNINQHTIFCFVWFSLVSMKRAVSFVHRNGPSWLSCEANMTRGNNIMMTMGSDFQYEDDWVFRKKIWSLLVVARFDDFSIFFSWC